VPILFDGAVTAPLLSDPYWVTPFWVARSPSYKAIFFDQTFCIPIWHNLFDVGGGMMLSRALEISRECERHCLKYNSLCLWKVGPKKRTLIDPKTFMLCPKMNFLDGMFTVR
jgi:hypothetical protein